MQAANGRIMKQPIKEMLTRDPSLLPWSSGG
jgi:hypothetical protein